MHRVSPAELFIAQRVNALTRTWSGAREGDVRAIHQARVASRRLREALPLIGSEKPARGVGRTARRLTRALGPVRELDVVLQMLTEFEASGDVPPAAIACLRGVIAEERRRLHDVMVRRLDRCDPAKLRKKALAAARRAPAAAGTRGARDPQRLAAAQQRAAVRAERLRAAIDGAAAIYLPDRLHEVRIAVKKLRYAMEIVKEVSGSRAAASILTLKRAQDLLGRMHDLEVLIARTRAMQGSAQVPNLRLSGELDGLVRRLETECRQLHGRYMTSRAKLLSICDRVTTARDRRAHKASPHEKHKASAA